MDMVIYIKRKEDSQMDRLYLHDKTKISELNGGKVFYAKNDRRHDVSITLSYEILLI